MKEKITKDSLISCRVPSEIEKLVEAYGAKHSWSKSFALYKILEKFFYEVYNTSM